MQPCVNCEALNADDAVICIKCGTQPTLVPPGTERTADFPGASGPAPGTRFAGRYEVLGLLGKGGMGTVFRVRDTELQEEMALKVLQRGVDPKEIDRLRREAVVARRITHPNVIRLHDFGVSAGEGYLSMEILRGGTLADRMRARVRPDDALVIARGIAAGLAAAHRAGIVHRDIKPLNVLFDAAGTPKLVDFGLARLEDASTRTIGFSGTPHYMSPEMANGGEITVRSDVYSFGVLLYELFTGRLPFLADTLVRLVVMHERDTPPRPRSLDPNISPALERVLLRCLEKDPARRYASAIEVEAELDAISRGDSRAVTAGPPLRRDRLVLGSAGALVLVALGLVTWQNAGKKAAAPAPSPTPIALASTTPLAVSSASPVTTTTSTPAARGTPARVAVVATPHPAASPVPTPRPVAKKNGLIRVLGYPPVTVTIDGKRISDKERVQGFSLPAGKHSVRVANPDFNFTKDVAVEILPEKTFTLRVNPNEGTAVPD